MRESRTSGSVGGLGEQSPRSTRLLPLRPSRAPRRACEALPGRTSSLEGSREPFWALATPWQG